MTSTEDNRKTGLENEKMVSRGERYERLEGKGGNEITCVERSLPVVIWSKILPILPILLMSKEWVPSSHYLSVGGKNPYNLILSTCSPDLPLL